MKSSGLRWVLGIFGLVLIVAIIAAVFAGLKMAAFKTELAQDLGHALGAEVEVSSLNLDLWKGQLQAAGIRLTNQRPEAPWDRGEISQATIHFHLLDFFAPTMPLTVEVSSWSVVLHPPPAGATPSAGPGPESGPASPETGAKRRVQVTQLSAHDGEVQIDLSPDKQVLIHGVAFDAGDNGAAVWTTHLQAASISAGSLDIGPSSVEMRADREGVTFSNFRMSCAQGMITGDGNLAFNGTHEARASLKAADIPVVMLVSVLWQMKLAGLASGDLAYHGNDQGGEAHGQMTVAGGKFNVLPFLGKVTSLVGLPDISGVEVDHASTDFTWKDHVLHLTNIDVRKESVMRVAGQLDVDGQSQVDGRLKLGLPSDITAKWPQIQTGIFPDAADGYNWTDVHVTGTPDHLQEDLTPRLLAAGLQQGSGLLNQGAQKASDLLKSLLGP
jgi:hypothetical protein